MLHDADILAVRRSSFRRVVGAIAQGNAPGQEPYNRRRMPGPLVSGYVDQLDDVAIEVPRPQLCRWTCLCGTSRESTRSRTENRERRGSSGRFVSSGSHKVPNAPLGRASGGATSGLPANWTRFVNAAPSQTVDGEVPTSPSNVSGQLAGIATRTLTSRNGRFGRNLPLARRGSEQYHSTKSVIAWS